MPAACHKGNLASASDSHGKPCCSHGVIGPSTAGSQNVFINSKDALRIGDSGVHSSCCGSNTWVNSAGSGTVFINGIPAVRLGDTTTHCGGVGSMVTASSDVSFG